MGITTSGGPAAGEIRTPDGGFEIAMGAFGKVTLRERHSVSLGMSANRR